MEAASYNRLDPNLACAASQDDEHTMETAVCQGAATDLGSFSIRTFKPVNDTGANHDSGNQDRNSPELTIYNLTAPEADIWKAKSIFLDVMKGSSNPQSRDQESWLPRTEARISGEPRKDNMQFVQKTFEGNFEFDILYSSESAPTPMTSSDLTTKLQNDIVSFPLKFNLTYGPKSPFQAQQYSEFSQSLLSNLMGGIGYFYGYNKVDTSYFREYQELDANFWEFAENARTDVVPETKGPFELFTSIPSRPFFPRGFLWDEGFHLQVVLDWDMDLALEILKSWVSLMDARGWIAREQILGPEAESKVPREFRTQYSHHANPPTVFLVLTAFIDRLTNVVAYSGTPSHYLQDPRAGEEYLKTIYPLLLRHYNWFRRTQFGQVARPGVWEGYRWRGRTHQHTFTSGLDDYPRAEPPHPGELHVDAISWVGLMAGSLHKISSFLDITLHQKMFDQDIQAIKESIEKLHWSEEHQTYCDATIEHETHVLKCHKGYVSLFPFLVGLLEPQNPRLGALLNLIRDERELWSPYGLRSLSRSSSLYGTGENYWRGPIWVNINYMVLERLLVSVILQMRPLNLFSFATGPGALSWAFPEQIPHNIYRTPAEPSFNGI
jgi:mannosyl-oligosaccharide glucosidase